MENEDVHKAKTWKEFRREFFTEEEIAESDMRVALIRPGYNLETKMAIDESKEILEHQSRFKSYSEAEEMFNDVIKIAKVKTKPYF